MARLRLSATIGYGILSIIGFVFVLDIITGSFGQLLGFLATVCGVSFLATGLYGLVTQRTLRQLPLGFKIALGIGVLALLTFVGLLALVLIALKNFS